MSLSRSGEKQTKLLTNQRKPSPTYQNFFLNFARGSETSVSGVVRHRFIRCRFAEGSSLFAFLSRKVKAGMTVEAAMVLPLFLFFILNMGSALEMIRLHGNVQLGLWDVGRKLSLYGYATEYGELWEETSEAAQGGTNGNGQGANGGQQSEATVEERDEEDGFWRQLAELIFASTYVRGQLVEKVGEKYLDESPVVGGSDGLMLLESEVLTGGDELELTVTYAVRPFFGLGENFGFFMANRYCAHLWNGYEIPGMEEGIEPTVAYLAENAQVYHLDRECSHLSLTVRQIHVAALGQVRNNYGERYTECSKCGGEVLSLCYIAEEGDCYHWDANCSGLKRTIRGVTLNEAKKYKPCSRCAKGRFLN